MQRAFLSGTAILTILVFAGSAIAGPAVSFSDAPEAEFVFENDGFEFHTNAAITITALGYFVSPQYDPNGLVASHLVGIFGISLSTNSTTNGLPTEIGTLLTSTTVSNGDPESGFFDYNQIAPITLAANMDYVAAAISGTPQPPGSSLSGDPVSAGVVNFSTDPGITFLEDRYGGDFDGVDLGFPTQVRYGGPPNNGLFGPNFLIAPAPEPSTFTLLSIALASIGAYSWRRRKQAAS